MTITSDHPWDDPVTVETDEGHSTSVWINESDDTAAYTIDGVDVDVDDGYTVTASADGYADDEETSVTVDVGEDVEGVDLLLEENGNGASSLSTTVLAGLDSNPLASGVS